jgi:hypothetical protein
VLSPPYVLGLDDLLQGVEDLAVPPTPVRYAILPLDCFQGYTGDRPATLGPPDSESERQMYSIAIHLRCTFELGRVYLTESIRRDPRCAAITPPRVLRVGS